MPHLKRTVRRPWLPEHKPQSGRRHVNTEFYRSAAWRKLRLVKLDQQPLCEECLKHDRHTPAQMVDHIVPINRGGAPLDFRTCNPSATLATTARALGSEDNTMSNL